MKPSQAGLTSLVGKLAAAKRVAPDGKVSFDDWQVSEYFALLASILLPKCKISDTNKYRLTHKAIITAVQRDSFTLESIKEEIEKAVRGYFSNRYNEYVLVTMVSVLPECLKNFTIYDNQRVNFCRTLPKKFKPDRDRITADACRILKCNIPDDYSYIWLRVHARDASDAITKGFTVLDALRAIWNFSFNYHGGRTYYNGLRKPINRITFSPIHTVHHFGDKHSNDYWWYNTEYVNAVPAYRDLKEFSKMLVRATSISRRLLGTRLRDNIIESLTRYSEALDSADCNKVILKLWAELEYLTSARNYDTLIKRCSFVFKDRELAILELNEIRNHRNMYAHKGDFCSSLQEDFMYATKKYIEGLLHFLIINGKLFSSMDEVGKFLELPSDSSKLGRQIELLRKAKSYFI